MPSMTKTDEQPTFDEALLRECRVLERILEIEYDFLEDSHPVAQYLQGRLTALFPQHPLRARVAVNEDQANAMCLPTGTIVLTRGLLGALDTQDELDVVLAHEAMHYIHRHTAEIYEHLEAAKRHHQGPHAVRAAVRILGQQRFSEYEADIRGVMAICDEVNPGAARSAFLKLAESSRAGARGAVHGGWVDRIINIGLVSQARDFVTTRWKQELLPEAVSEFASRASTDWLYERVRNAVAAEVVEDSARRARISETLLALNRIVHRQEARPVQIRNVRAFRQKCIPHLQRRIRAVLKECTEDECDVVLHALLELCVGLRTDETANTPYADVMRSFEDLDSVQQLRSRVELLTSDRLERLGAVIPRFGDAAAWVALLLQRANENELFIEPSGSFDLEGYLALASWLAKHFEALTEDHGLQPIRIEELTPALVGEALLNLDLSRTNQPLFDLVAGFTRAGVALDPFKTLAAIQEQGHSRQSEEQVEQLQAELTRSDPHWRRFTELPSAEHRVDFSMFNDESWDREGRLKALFDNSFQEAGLDGVRSYARWLGARLEEQRPTSEQEAFDNMLAMVTLHFLRNGASFLPEPTSERALILMAMLRSDPCEAFNTAIVDMVGQLEILFAWHDWIDVAAVIDGTHPIYEEQGWDRPTFQPARFADPLAGVRPTGRIDMAWKLHRARERSDSFIFQTLIDIAFFLFESERNIDTPMDVAVAHRFLCAVSEFAFRNATRIPSACLVGDEERTAHASEFVAGVIEQTRFDLDNPESQELLLDLSVYFGDMSLGARVQSAILSRRLRDADFGGGLTMLFNDPRTRMSMTMEVKERFLEDEVTTHAEIAAASRTIEQYVSEIADPSNVGALVIMEALTDQIRGRQEVFVNLMEMARDERPVRDFFFGMYRAHSPADELAIVEANFRVQQLARTSDLVRFALVRQFLVGDGGFLHTETGRLWLLHYLFEEFIATEEDDELGERLHALIQEVLERAAAVADTDLLFFAVSPLIHERIMRAPSEPQPWEPLLQELYAEDETVQATLAAVAKLEGGEDITVSWQDAETIEQDDGSTEYRRVWKEKRILANGDKILAYQSKIDELLQGEGRADEALAARWSIEEFTIKIAETLGSPGVRFLQIIGQYVELPTRLEESFQDVYDNVRGQGKLTACHTLAREWPDFDPAVTRVVDRIGGGSITTVYRCEMADGSMQVVKVVNPNAELHLQTTMDLLVTTFDALVQRRPDRYAIARAVLDEIDAWIRQDLTYDRFWEQDPVFRQRYHGWHGEGDGPRLYIPESWSPSPDGSDNYHVKREEFVPGETLTRFRSDPDTMKGIGSLLAKNYLQQIIDGLVHSDVHPGNFIVFTDAEGSANVAVIDRNNYIELGPTEKVLLHTLQSSATAGNHRATLELVTHYIGASGSAQATAADIDEMTRDLALGLNGRPRTLTTLVSQVMLTLKKHGFKVPLTLTLMVKNLNGLNHLVRRMGFETLSEAFEWRSAQARP